jgi:hypothetical protein
MGVAVVGTTATSAAAAVQTSEHPLEHAVHATRGAALFAVRPEAVTVVSSSTTVRTVGSATAFLGATGAAVRTVVAARVTMGATRVTMRAAALAMKAVSMVLAVGAAVRTAVRTMAISLGTVRAMSIEAAAVGTVPMSVMSVAPATASAPDLLLDGGDGRGGLVLGLNVDHRMRLRLVRTRGAEVIVVAN